MGLIFSLRLSHTMKILLAVLSVLVASVAAIPSRLYDVGKDVSPAMSRDDWMHKWIHGHIQHHGQHVHNVETVTKTIVITTVVHNRYHNLVHQCQTNTYNARRKCRYQAHFTPTKSALCRTCFTHNYPS